MTTFNSIPKDVIAAQVASRLALGDRNSLMRCSRACLVICQSDPVWAPMVRGLFLMKTQEKTCYETVKDFYESYALWSNRLLVASAPKGVFAKVSSCVKSLVTPKKKEIVLEANRRRLQSQQFGKKLDSRRRAYFAHCILGADIEVAFHLHQIIPNFILTKDLLEKAMSKENWPMALQLAQSDHSNQELMLWALAGKRFLEKNESKVFEELFKTAQLAECVRHRMFVSAAEKGNLQAVIVQLQSGLISDSGKICEAIVQASGKDQVAIIQEIIEKKGITGACRAQAIIVSATTGNLVALGELLKLGPLSFEVAVDSYRIADAMKRHFVDDQRYPMVLRELERCCPDVIPVFADQPSTVKESKPF